MIVSKNLFITIICMVSVIAGYEFLSDHSKIQKVIAFMVEIILAGIGIFCSMERDTESEEETK